MSGEQTHDELVKEARDAWSTIDSLFTKMEHDLDKQNQLELPTPAEIKKGKKEIEERIFAVAKKNPIVATEAVLDMINAMNNHEMQSVPDPIRSLSTRPYEIIHVGYVVAGDFFEELGRKLYDGMHKNNNELPDLYVRSLNELCGLLNTNELSILGREDHVFEREQVVAVLKGLNSLIKPLTSQEFREWRVSENYETISKALYNVNLIANQNGKEFRKEVNVAKELNKTIESLQKEKLKA